MLPRRGIHARPDEVLVTADGQQALHLTVELLVEAGTTVAVEEPGNPELVALLRRRGAEIMFQPVDREGMVVDERLAECGVVYVSPGHQRPTGVALSAERRAALMAMAAERDFIVVEDDFESEADDLEARRRPCAPAGRRDALPMSRRSCSRSRRRCASACWSPRPHWCARRARFGASRRAPAALRAAHGRATARARSLRHDHGARRRHVPPATAGAARCAQPLPGAPDRHPAGARRHGLLGDRARIRRRAGARWPPPRRAAC